MASCFSCFTASFTYHFDNFTFARSRESVHNHHNSQSRLQSLRPISFVSLTSNKKGNHRRLTKSPEGRALPDLNRVTAQRKPSADVTSFYSSRHRSPEASSRIPKDDDSQVPKISLEQQLAQSRVYKDPRRHVSFARVPSQRTASELYHSPSFHLLNSIFYQTCPSFPRSHLQVKV